MSRPDNPRKPVDPPEFVEFVGHRGVPSQPRLSREEAALRDSRLGRRGPSLAGLLLPPVAVACLITVAVWLPLTWSDSWAWLPAILLIVGVGACEFAALRCSADVKRARPARWAYVADWVALAAFGLATILPLIGLLAVERLHSVNWRGLGILSAIFAVAAYRLRERRRKALVRFDTTVVNTFD